MPLHAGDLDRHIELLRYALTRDADNQPVEAWTAIRTVSASWRRASARETLAAEQALATATDVFEIRWAADLTSLNAKDRLIHKGASYDIAAVAEIGRREGLRITASRPGDGAEL